MSRTQPAAIIGNRLALVGAIVYLLEWAAIVFIAEIPTDRLGDNAEEIAAAYRGEATSMSLAAGWFSIVLLGRVLFVAAVRRAFLDSGYRSTWLDLAVGAMVVSVALEIGSLGLPAAGAWLAEADADPAAIVALDAAGSIAFVMAYGPIGVSIAATAVAMLQAHLFPVWVRWLGVAAGILMLVGGFVGTAALGSEDYADLGDTPSSIGALVFWVWMLATAIILFRRTPTGTSGDDAAPVTRASAG